MIQPDIEELVEVISRRGLKAAKLELQERIQGSLMEHNWVRLREEVILKSAARIANEDVEQALGPEE
jgi:hypothetical protein